MRCCEVSYDFETACVASKGCMMRWVRVRENKTINTGGTEEGGKSLH